MYSRLYVFIVSDRSCWQHEGSTQRYTNDAMQCATCETAAEGATSFIDDIGLHGEVASIVIIGGGPHALAALTALHDEGTRVGLDSRVGTGS